MAPSKLKVGQVDTKESERKSFMEDNEENKFYIFRELLGRKLSSRLR